MPTLAEEYLESLSEQEQRALEIAKEHLGSSFSLEDSIGFLKFKEAKAKDAK